MELNRPRLCLRGTAPPARGSSPYESEPRAQARGRTEVQVESDWIGYESDAALARAHGLDSIRVRWRGPNSSGTVTAAFVPGGSWLHSTGNPRADDVLKAVRTIFHELSHAPATAPMAIHRLD